MVGGLTVERETQSKQFNVSVHGLIPVCLVMPLLFWRSLQRYKNTFYNHLFHRDKSSEKDFSSIYRGYKSPAPVPNLDSLATQDSPAWNASSSSKSQRIRQSSEKLIPVSQGVATPNSEKQSQATPMVQLISKEEKSSIETAGLRGEISEMLLYLKTPPTAEGNEDTSPMRLLSLVQQGRDIQLDSTPNCFGILTPTDKTIFTADATTNVPVGCVPSEARWNDYPDMYGCTAVRQVDEISDLSTEETLHASDIFHTPSASLQDLSAFCLDIFSMPTIQPICSEWNRSSSGVKGFQRDSLGALTPIIKTLETTFKSADPRYQSTATPVQQDPIKQQFDLQQQPGEADSTPCGLLQGSCAQFSPLVPKFNPSGWAILLPEVCSLTEEDVTIP